MHVPVAAVSDPLSTVAADPAALLERIVCGQLVQVVFQPIVYLGTGGLVGYEALVRGPSDSLLYSPVALFEQAAQSGMLAALDRMCVTVVLREFARRHLPGTLFVNVIPDTLLDGHLRAAELRDMLAANGLDPSRVVLELTEMRPQAGYRALCQVADELRREGVRLALDDLGEGFSNLRLWSELRPDLVKLDKYFVQQIHLDPLKLQFVRSLVDMARAAGAVLVAEGIELPQELDVLRELGVVMGQGYLIARPTAQPLHSGTFVLPGSSKAGAASRMPTVRELQCEAPYLTDRASCVEAYRLFADNPSLFAVPVLAGRRPVGLLSRSHVLELFAKPFNHELLAKKSCLTLADRTPLVVPADTDIQTLSTLVAAAERRHLVDGFIIVEGQQYLGMGTGQDLVRAISEMQLLAARYANPLTGLPGNVPISDQVARLLAQGRPFVVAYVDLDNFKPFNDHYGYGAGDDMIRLLGELLQTVADPALDFVGHIGGDDFVMLLQGAAWRQCLQQVLTQFDQLVLHLFSATDRLAGGFHVADRHGVPHFFPLTSVSVGVLPVVPAAFDSHYEVAAAATLAKKGAKQRQGSALYVAEHAAAGAPLLLGV
ncbi:GGDEF domain-containing protein [Vogesella sp. LIG4]|uniref:GGDEF domain-containing protein n=1 Tax=Vogesella sp. LIG4 TaxID=1192162 RepID=UPI00081F9D6D|nr:GGDEF domain-containing protein [Vogesella sp. LIG4]SCK28981.1 diguanylate cyclase (GGDEF) domain-containing protein [Vogesella sp. LIG4]